MSSTASTAFAVRLRDLLATLESTALLGVADNRLRGLGEQLQFACLALPCSEALVAIEMAHIGKLRVPGVATADGWRAVELEFGPSGTPFAYLLGGGSGYAAEIEHDDSMLDVLRPVIESDPRQCLFVPIRIGASVVGGAALLRDDSAIGADPAGELALGMAERLAEVLSLTLESFRTERVLLQLFAQMLPELCAPDSPTGLARALAEYLHAERLDPVYRRRIALAELVGRIAGRGEPEARLAMGVLTQVEQYVATLTGEPGVDDDWGSGDGIG